MSDFEKALDQLRAENAVWVGRATCNAFDVGLLRHALRRIADDDAAGARYIARDALAKLAEDEAAREARGEFKARSATGTSEEAARVREALAGLVKDLPQCAACVAPATASGGDDMWCDEHAPDGYPEMAHAAGLRFAVATLANEAGGEVQARATPAQCKESARLREAIERTLATFDAPHDASCGAAWHLANCIRAVLNGGDP